MDWGKESEKLEAEYTEHLNQFIQDMMQKPEVLKALNEIGDKHGLPPLTEKQIAEMLYGRQKGSAHKKRKTRKTRRKRIHKK